MTVQPDPAPAHTWSRLRRDGYVGVLTTTAQPDVDRRTDEDVQTGPPRVAHIVRTDPGESAIAKVTEARIYGYPVEALCGARFVPQRDPTKLPMCQACKEIYDLYRMANDGLNDTPAPS